MVSKQEQQLIAQAQVYQQQMQILSAQKEALNAQSSEIKKALEELKKTAEKEVYRIAGPVLIKDKKTAVIDFISEKQKVIDAQMKRIETNEKRIKEKVDELVGKLKG